MLRPGGHKPPATRLPAVPVRTPVTGSPATATAAAATPKPFKVTPDQTVSGQIKNIIASGSPLMQQAETNAKNLMNQRGLINSSQAITAGQSALYWSGRADRRGGCEHLCQSRDRHDQRAKRRARRGGGCEEHRRFAECARKTRPASSPALRTRLRHGPADRGSTNIAEIQSSTSKAIANLQSNTTLTAQDKQNAGQQLIASIQSNTALSQTDKQT
jgi:hypothetical protein